ncbi:MAG TPA: alkaline phosphatase family protein [Thermoanaerobaculia bacterium]|nr:alkaline phosphatase family protein [Thermoanaerobaculia bacterium]
MIRLLLVALLVAFPLFAEPPDLVVVISVDQLRFDYVDRFAPWFTERGFKRFTREGATFPNARYRYSTTFTGPGHASIGTGLLPAESGILGNSWFERDAPVDLARWDWYFDDIAPYRPKHITLTPFTAEGDWWWKDGGSPMYCTYDARVSVTAGKTIGMSPANLAGDGLADRIKEKYPEGRVIALALKDRASILMGGRRADAAYWFDYRVPGFISSTYYRFNPEAFSFNALIPGYLPASARWTPSPYIPPEEMQRATFDPPEAWPLKNNTYGGTFPHPVPHVRAMTYTPFAHRMLLDFAQHVIATEQLGTRKGDALFVGISSTDYLGHYYGPDSMEVADSMVRLDRMLGDFLDAIERRFGKRVVVALTSDHGVQPNPEIVKLRDPHADAGRLDVRTPDAKARFISDLPPARVEIERALAKKLALRFDERAPLQHALVYFFEEPGLWLNWKRIDALGLDGERVRIALRDVLRAMKHHGIDDVWTSTEMLTPNPHASRVEELMRASFRSDRSGDVLIALRPGWMWHWGSNSTTHGQPVENDMRVPLMLWGSGIEPGVYDVESSPLDLARTLGALMDVDAGGRTSRVLPCVEGRRHH